LDVCFVSTHTSTKVIPTPDHSCVSQWTLTNHSLFCHSLFLHDGDQTGSHHQKDAVHKCNNSKVPVALEKEFIGGPQAHQPTS